MRGKERTREEEKNAKQRSNRKWAIKLNDKIWLANFKRDLLLFSIISFVCVFVCLFVGSCFLLLKFLFHVEPIWNTLVYLFIQFYYRSVACFFIIMFISFVDVFLVKMCLKTHVFYKHNALLCGVRHNMNEKQRLTNERTINFTIE